MLTSRPCCCACAWMVGPSTAGSKMSIAGKVPAEPSELVLVRARSAASHGRRFSGSAVGSVGSERCLRIVWKRAVELPAVGVVFGSPKVSESRWLALVTAADRSSVAERGGGRVRLKGGRELEVGGYRRLALPVLEFSIL